MTHEPETHGTDAPQPVSVSREIDADLSVTLPVSHHFDTVRLVLEHLAAQTVADRLEIVLLVEHEDMQVDASAFDAFAGWQVGVVSEFDSAGRVRGEGVRLARAPLVWFAEDHGFPNPTALESLLRVHRQRHAITGVVVENANPATAVSWADIFLNFGPYIGRRELEDLGHLAWHKSLYPRDFLLEFDEELDDLLDVEGRLQERARERGYALVIVPEARLYHLNISRFWTFLRNQAVNGRLYGSSRGASWPFWKRLAYTGALPLIVAVRSRRLVAEVLRAGEAARLPGMLPHLLVGLTVNQVWEIVGYMAGPGRARSEKADAEYRRYRFMSDADCRRIFGVEHGRAPAALVSGWTTV